MVFIYPAIITRTPDGHYNGYFPDLDHAEFDGISLDRAIDDAHDIMYGWIDCELASADPELPPVSDISSDSLEPDQQVCNISIHYRFSEGWDE